MPNKQKQETYVLCYDMHFPHTDWSTYKALLSFIEQNDVDGFIFGGDQFSNDCISHHTRGKPMLRDKGAYKKEEEQFVKKVLDPLDGLLGDITKVWIEGNHDNWEQQLVEEQPELDGIQRGPSLYSDSPGSLELSERGWQFVPCGKSFKKGFLTFIHGETLTGIGNQAGVMHSKKAVESYCANVVYGHVHSPQSFTKVLPHDETQKWQSWCMPILGNVNPGYLRNKPTAWLNGFGVVEFRGDGTFNVYPVICIGGKCSYGGKVYGG